jgi:Skp family chaperone for outer membrane proteins
MEREIIEWSKTRERELREQALKMREEIVAEITASINQLGGEGNAILDVSGLSLNGVPFVVHYPATADMTERVTSALNGGQSSPLSSAHNLKIALVNMNEVFKQFNKTKASEAQINEGKAAAKKEYDEKAERYKKELADVPSSPGTARDQQVARVKEMEHDINEWRAAREKGFRDQALKMREEIVAEITKEIKARVVAEKMAVVLDIGGFSLNGVPVIICTTQIPDLSDQVVAALNETTGKSRKTTSSATAFASSAQLRFGCVDITRVFKAMPETKQAEAEVNNLKEKAKAELANPDAKAREAKEKELQDIATKMREPIVQKITAGVREFAEAAGFNVIFDASGNSLNGVPLLVSKHDFPDLTDQLISQLTQSR